MILMVIISEGWGFIRIIYSLFRIINYFFSDALTAAPLLFTTKMTEV